MPDIRLQARALEPLLDAAPGQKIMLVGQSYGAAIATLMAAARPASSPAWCCFPAIWASLDPTAQWLVKLGARVLGVIPRDLRHAVIEVGGQPAQLVHMRDALKRLRVPVHLIHGDQDDFAPVEQARKFADEARRTRPLRFESVPGGDHFLNNGPPERLLTCLEACIPARADNRWGGNSSWSRQWKAGAKACAHWPLRYSRPNRTALFRSRTRLFRVSLRRRR